MGKILKNYILALFFSILAWNLIIGNSIFNQATYINDPKLGNKYPANTRYVSDREGYANFVSDNFGFNNGYIETEPKAGVIRILSLGDSITESVQVGRNDNYSDRLEKKLNQAGGKFEVLNLGVSGKSIPDYIIYASGYISTFSPDFFIIKIEASDFLGDATDTSKQNFLIRKGGTFKIAAKENAVDKTIIGRLKLIKDNSGWFQPIIKYTLIKLPKLRNILNGNSGGEQSANETAAVSGENALRTKEEMIDWQINKLKEAYGPKFIFIYISSNPAIVKGKIVATEDKETLETKKIIELDCKKYGVPFIDTTDDFNKFYYEKEKMPRGFNNNEPGAGHLNKDGHEIVADKLYNYLKNINLESEAGLK